VTTAAEVVVASLANEVVAASILDTPGADEVTVVVAVVAEVVAEVIMILSRDVDVDVEGVSTVED